MTRENCEVADFERYWLSEDPRNLKAVGSTGRCSSLVAL